MFLPALFTDGENGMQHYGDQPYTVPSQLKLTPAVFEHIRETIGMKKAETGGILGGCRQTGEVAHFCFDEAAQEQSGIAYTPNNTFLNNVIKTRWKPQGIDYLGSIHSHPPFYQHLSAGDEIYARRIIEALDLPYLLTPIVTTIADTGVFSLFPFAAVSDGDGVRIVEQELFVGGGPAVYATQRTPTIPEPEAIPWEVWVLVVGAGAFTAGLATAQLIRLLKQHVKVQEGDLGNG